MCSTIEISYLLSHILKCYCKVLARITVSIQTEVFGQQYEYARLLVIMERMDGSHGAVIDLAHLILFLTQDRFTISLQMLIIHFE